MNWPEAFATAATSISQTVVVIAMLWFAYRRNSDE